MRRLVLAAVVFMLPAIAILFFHRFTAAFVLFFFLKSFQTAEYRLIKALISIVHKMIYSHTAAAVKFIFVMMLVTTTHVNRIVLSWLIASTLLP